MASLEVEKDISNNLWDTSLSYITRNSSINDHKHYCYKVAVSLDHYINCKVSEASHVAIRGFIVNQGKRHSCAAPEGPVLNSLIEPESMWGKKMKELLGTKDFLRFEEVIDTSTISPILPKNYQALPNEKLTDHVEKLMNRITGTGPHATHPIDDRIEKVLNYISENISGDISKQAILDLTFLSYERTRHLFAEQMGIPLSRYILWQRLRRTLKEVISGEANLTKISAKYGFTDLSHFNKTFRRIFGFNPSTFLLEARIII